jgi:hypothetical protein
MKTIISGTRNIIDEGLVFGVLDSLPWKVISVISGGAKGVDVLGVRWARLRGIPCQIIKAEWEAYGLGAGVIRNTEMARFGEALAAIWDGESSGTRDMIQKMRAARKLVYVYNLKLHKGNTHEPSLYGH